MSIHHSYSLLTLICCAGYLGLPLQYAQADTLDDIGNSINQAVEGTTSGAAKGVGRLVGSVIPDKKKPSIPDGAIPRVGVQPEKLGKYEERALEQRQQESADIYEDELSQYEKSRSGKEDAFSFHGPGSDKTDSERHEWGQAFGNERKESEFSFESFFRRIFLDLIKLYMEIKKWFGF